MPPSDTTPPPPPSLVLLFRSPRTFIQPLVRAAAERAFGVPFASEPGGKRYVVPLGKPGTVATSGRYAVRFMEYLLGVAQGTQPFWSDPTFGADLLGDPRAREAVGAHHAWIAVDGLGLADSRAPSRTTRVPADRKSDVYRVMSRLTLELFNLAEEDCTALVVPEIRRVYPNGASWASGTGGEGGTEAEPVNSIRDMLSTKEPAMLLGVTGPAMLEDDDPRILEAIAEARRHLPRFLKAWEARGQGPDKGAASASGKAAKPGEGDAFWVKASFSDPNGSEQMWVAVTSIRDGVIEGTLQSDPSFVHSVRHGQKVELKLDEVVDFLYHDGRAMAGAFTDRVIRDIMEGRR